MIATTVAVTAIRTASSADATGTAAAETDEGMVKSLTLAIEMIEETTEGTVAAVGIEIVATDVTAAGREDAEIQTRVSVAGAKSVAGLTRRTRPSDLAVQAPSALPEIAM